MYGLRFLLQVVRWRWIGGFYEVDFVVRVHERIEFCRRKNAAVLGLACIFREHELLCFVMFGNSSRL